MKKLTNIIKFLLIVSASGVISTTTHSEEWDKNITSKIDVDSFWLEVKKVREIKYGVDASWDKNMDYCSYSQRRLPLLKEKD